MPAGRAGRPVQPDNEGVNSTTTVGRYALKKSKKIANLLLCHFKCFLSRTRLFWVHANQHAEVFLCVCKFTCLKTVQKCRNKGCKISGLCVLMRSCSEGTQRWWNKFLRPHAVSENKIEKKEKEIAIWRRRQVGWPIHTSTHQQERID